MPSNPTKPMMLSVGAERNSESGDQPLEGEQTATGVRLISLPGKKVQNL